MRNISLSQILIVIFLGFFIFGDFESLKKKAINLYKTFITNNRKKGT